MQLSTVIPTKAGISFSSCEVTNFKETPVFTGVTNKGIRHG